MTAPRKTSCCANCLHFCVAGVNFTLHCTEIEQLKRLIPSYAPFWLRSTPDVVAMNADIVLGGAEKPGSEAHLLGDFDCGGTSHVMYGRPEGGYELCIHDFDGGLAARLTADADFTQCTVHTSSDDGNRAYGLGNALMIAYTFCAAQHNVVLMHSSVVMNGGCGYMFLGKSGTGKSTHTKLWLRNFQETELLNDDNPAVRVAGDGQIDVYGTPWSGKTPCYRNLHCPVGAIVRLKQAPHNKIQRENPLGAYASIISSCSSMMWDKPSYSAIRRTAEAMAMHIPVFMLECLPDDAAAQLSHLHTTTAAQGNSHQH